MLITSAVMNDLESLAEVLLDVIVRCMLSHRRCCFTLHLFFQNISMIGIAFNLIIIRVGNQRAKDAHHCEVFEATGN